jgi:hypothetical protein
MLCVAAIDAELEVCLGERGRNYGPATDHDGHTQRTSTVNHGHQRTVVHARQPCRPDLGVKGSRVQISPARQVNVGLSHLIRAAFIRPPAHPRLVSAPGSWAQIGPTSASTPPPHRARPGDLGEDNGSSPPGLDGRPPAGEGAARRRRRPSRSAPCVAGRAARGRPAQDHQPTSPTPSHRAGSRW